MAESRGPRLERRFFAADGREIPPQRLLVADAVDFLFDSEVVQARKG